MLKFSDPSVIPGMYKTGDSGIEMPNEGRYLLLSDEHQDGDMAFGHKPDKAWDVVDKAQVGDHIGVLNYGFVELKAVQSSDESIVEDARTSYVGGGKKTVDRTLLRYLMRHSHSTPTEMSSLKFRLYIPIVVYRQLFRHRAATQLEPQFMSNDDTFQKFSVQNEMSGRYVELPDHYYYPELRRIQKQSTANKQGSANNSLSEVEQQHMLERMKIAVNSARGQYSSLLEMGVAKETARNILPLTQYTLLIWRMDLKNLLHFLSLRLDKHAQWEVRQYAKAISEFVKSYFPITWEAFCDYQLNAVKFSHQEITALREVLTDLDKEKMFTVLRTKITNERERQEFAAKIELLL